MAGLNSNLFYVFKGCFMNQLLNKWERKFGRYAIPNLTTWIILAYVLGYVIQLFMPQVFLLITLDPYAIIHKLQIWRLVTWILIPPGSLGIFTIIMLFFYYSLGNTLERSWGAFRYNLYIFSGMFFTMISAFILYFVYVGLDMGLVQAYGPEQFSMALSTNFNTYYINLSIFLAFAANFPDMQVLLYFIIPIKMKWLAVLDVVLLAFGFVTGGVVEKVIIVASLLNFILFYLGTRNYRRISPKEVHRRYAYQQQVKRPQSVTKHKCAICGRTEKDGENLEFRFCSKCDGNYEYCQEHLFTHTHVRNQ